MCRRWTPSNCDGSAASAARARPFSASVLNSTRRAPSRSKACSSSRYFASVFAPVPQLEETSQVLPISIRRCSGTCVISQELPTRRPPARSRVAKGRSEPASAPSNQRENASGSARSDGNQRKLSGLDAAAAASPSRCPSASGSSVTTRPSSGVRSTRRSYGGEESAFRC